MHIRRVSVSALCARAACLCLFIGAALAAPAQTSGAASAPLAPPAANGPLPVYIEEFFLSDAVRSEDRGELQLTVDTMAFRGRGSSMDGKSADLDIEFGVTNRLQLQFETPYGIQSTAASEIPVSWSSASVGLLYQFVRGNRPFALSGAMSVNLPLNDRGETSYEPELLIAKAFGKLQLHTSVSPELSDDDKSLAYNAALVRPFAHNLIPTLEFNGRRNVGQNSYYVTPGLYKHLPHRLEMGVALPAGIGRHSSPVGAVFKVTWEMGGDKDGD